MKEQTFKKAIHFSLFMLVALGGHAQTTTVRASVDKTNILIGEQVNLVVEANIPENEPIGFFSPDSISHFEFIQKGKIDTTNTHKGTILKQLFRITSFDSGQWVIPSFNFPQAENLHTDSIIVNVGYLPMDTAKDYNDIREIIDVGGKPAEDWTWYYVGGGALLLLLIIYLLTRKKKKVVQAAAAAAAEKIIDPYQDAMSQLDEVEKQNLPARGETKQYYSRLTDIFRVYLERKKGIQSLQQTTDDLVRQLKTVKLPDEVYQALSQSLRLSDFVKFAKYIPTEADHRQVIESIRHAIRTIEPMSEGTAQSGINPS